MASGEPYFVMPYVKGGTLADRLKALGPLDAREVGRILSEVASALAAAHACNVIHRDVRPANILVEEVSGRTYLADFGIAGALESGDEEVARLTRTGELLGNLEYISPEQRDGLPLDDRSDMYSLGVMGLELLGAKSDVGKSSTQLLDSNLIDFLRRATHTEPAQRPSAAELAQTLSRYSTSEDKPRGLFQSLRDRRMLPFVAAYVAGGLAAMGGVDQLVQQGLLAPISYRLALAFFVAGLNVTVITAWFHGRKGRQRVSRIELVLLAAVTLAWLTATALILSQALPDVAT
jgi:serine/threonine protein kinase